MKRLWVLALLPLFVAACGGGGGGGGGVIPPPDDDLEANFTGNASGGGAGDVSMGEGASSAADFDVDLRIEGPLANFFGLALRIQVPDDIDLIPGSSGAGSILLQQSPSSTIFSASQAQAGDEVLVTATRVQPASPGFDSGVDVPAGTSHVMTLRFRATDATSGNMSPTNTELRTCNDGTETCSALVVTFTGGSIVAN